ncbi:MAG: glycoside hydrolase family 13 protein [Acetatifactor sp.]|nr:glycoside hydrolase family 13 protein [Acetatifactor sp.]
MEKAAVVHNPDNYFFYSTGRDTFTVKLVAKAGDVSLAALHYRDKYIPLDKLDTRGKVPMRRVAGDGLHDYYEAELKVNMLCIRYFFELTDSRGEVVYYGNYSFYDRMPECIEEMFDCPQLSREEEKYEAPEWAKGKVVYQIFVDRFATDKNVPAEEWYREDLGHKDSLRGSLKGITQRIPYLKELGAEVLYLTPIFEAETTHKYDTVDYMRVDPGFGTEEDLRELTETAHGAGMYVILDAVFNHTSRHFFAFQDLQQNQEASRYRDWYYVDEFPARGELMPSYRSFSYFGGMPKLNCRNPEVRDYIFGVIRHWTGECHVDGWRLDVADEIGRDFWREFRRELRKVNPQALIVGEIWHFNGSYLEGDQWDSVMNYHFTEAVKGFLLERTLTAKGFAERLDFVRGRLKGETVPLLWNLIDSHDTDRFLTQAGGDRKLLKLAAALQLLLPGMPMIYYGDEAGMTGKKKGSGCRRGMLWEKERQDAGLLEYYKRLIAIRKKYPAVGRGEVHWKLREGADRLLCWETELSGETGVAVAVNCGGDTQDCSEWAGRRIAASEAVFEGVLEPFQAVVLEFIKKS